MIQNKKHYTSLAWWLHILLFVLTDVPNITHSVHTELAKLLATKIFNYYTSASPKPQNTMVRRSCSSGFTNLVTAKAAYYPSGP